MFLGREEMNYGNYYFPASGLNSKELKVVPPPLTYNSSNSREKLLQSILENNNSKKEDPIEVTKKERLA
ncbi:hypothetical protein CDAR_475471 [Caerostris darwini]|uniref:Uncharacterized protein n=1 Tax=Caerostris darwini TaxID=1538125 RepID=A0AAV4P8H9_9ARAC|nr:hypothetical protein CDAR_475471 [Caerostris darwini]